MTKANWQLPPGVSRGTWDYVNSKAIASDYDDYVSNNALLQTDEDLVRQIIDERQQSSPVVADFGCGTGRIARALLPLGCRMINIDLSEHMLAEVEKSIPSEYREQSRQVSCSLVDLDNHIAPKSVDVGLCLFSSIGMIAGRKNRRKFLAAAKRSIAPGGVLLLHVHNRYSSLFDPGGPKWLLSTWVQSWRSPSIELGDRVYAYRGLPSMFLHIYSHRELVVDLKSAGFASIETRAISIRGDEVSKRKGMFHSLRAGGYFALCAD